MLLNMAVYTTHSETGQIIRVDLGAPVLTRNQNSTNCLHSISPYSSWVYRNHYQLSISDQYSQQILVIPPSSLQII